MIRADYKSRDLKPTKKQLRVGHAGTLDPFATGLLIVLLGDKCAEADKFLKLDKTYEFTARLGQVSTTGDPEGEITESSTLLPSEEDINNALKEFTGSITQTPPAYSAIKVNGQRAYKLAREGKPVELPKRQVVVHDLELLSFNYPNLVCRASVSSGTYIRSLVEDLGKHLSTGAYCSQLRRISIGDYEVSSATTIGELKLD